MSSTYMQIVGIVVVLALGLSGILECDEVGCDLTWGESRWPLDARRR